MYSILVLVACALVGVAFARREAQVPIHSYKVRNNLKHFRGFSFNANKSGWLFHDANVDLNNTGTQKELLATKGSYSHTGTDGVNNNGSQLSSKSSPIPPVIPPQLPTFIPQNTSYSFTTQTSYTSFSSAPTKPSISYDAPDDDSFDDDNLGGGGIGIFAGCVGTLCGGGLG